MVFYWYFFFFFKQKTAYEMRISDWSSDVCSSDLFDISVLPDMVAAGHELACHTLAHLDCALTGPADLSADLDRNAARLAELEIGRASCRERVDSTGRSRWSPDH